MRLDCDDQPTQRRIFRQPHIGTNIQLRLVLHLNPIAFVEVSRIPYLGGGDLLLVVIEFGGVRDYALLDIRWSISSGERFVQDASVRVVLMPP